MSLHLFHLPSFDRFVILTVVQNNDKGDMVVKILVKEDRMMNATKCCEQWNAITAVF